jgi:hypothetical protein
MKRIAFAVSVIAIALSQFSGAVAEPDNGITTADNLADLKSRIRILRGKGLESLSAFFEVTGQKGGYRVLFQPFDKPPTEAQKVFVDLYVAASFVKGSSDLVCSYSATQNLCGGKFHPSWLIEPKDADPTAETLAAWVVETEVAIEPLWTGLCKLATDKTGKADFCNVRRG